MRAAWLSIAAFFLGQPAPQTFRCGAEAVRVDVLVMDGRNPVPGLTAANFELRDSGITQRIETVSQENVPLSLMHVAFESTRITRKPLGGYRLDFRSGIQEPLRGAVENIPTAVLLEPFLDALAEETGGKVVQAERSDKLRDTPKGVDADGWHPIEVKVKGRRAGVTARRGYVR